MYVAITRAMERLYLTCAKSRYMYGKQSFSTVSRFVKELGYEKERPNSYFDSSDEDVEYQNSYSSKYQNGYGQNHHNSNTFTGSISSFMHQNTQKKEINFAVGDRVFHGHFGVGYITSIDAQTKTAKIDFDSFGNKTLSLEFAPIKKM